MNLSASRSTIEDADYAAASTELAKTQIMQQAATAVLAQANTSQQSVLKLLGG
jgi:flagellin